MWKIEKITKKEVIENDKDSNESVIKILIKILQNLGTQIHMNKPIYSGLLVLDLSKTVMCEFWYDSVKPRYSKKAKLCYMDIDNSFLT